MVGAVVTLCFVMPKASRSAPEAPRKPIVPAQVPVVPSRGITTISLNGEFAPDASKTVLVGDGSTRIKKALVKVGQQVEKGQVLAVVFTSTAPRFEAPRFDARAESSHARQLSDSLGQALADHEGALATATQAFEAATKEHDATIKKAQAELDDARLAPPAQLGAAREAYENARSTRDKAKTLADRDTRALEEGWVSRNQATASKAAYDVAESAFRDAEEKYQRLNQGASEAEVRAARERFTKVKSEADNKLQVVKTNLERVQSGGLAFGASNRIEMPTFRFPVSGAIKGRIGKPVEMKSPVKGTILRADEHGFQILAEGGSVELVANVPGDTAAALRAGMIVRLPNDSHGFVKAIGGRDAKTGLVIVRVACPTVSTVGKGQATVTLAT